MTARHPACHGGKWIRQEKRLAIYLRDGLACVWCRRAVEDDLDISLTLDHLVPTSRKGSNDPANLVTACRSCNSRRQQMPMTQFASYLADFHLLCDDPETAEDILRRVERHRRRILDMAAARTILALRRESRTEAAPARLRRICERQATPA